MGQVAAGREAEAHDRVAGLQERHHDGAVRLRARMRLDVRELAAEQFLCALDRERFDGVRGRASLVITAARIAFRIFVREDGALRLEHRLADDILRGDQLDLRLLAAKLVVDRILDRGIDLAESAGEEAVRNAVDWHSRSRSAAVAISRCPVVLVKVDRRGAGGARRRNRCRGRPQRRPWPCRCRSAARRARAHWRHCARGRAAPREGRRPGRSGTARLRLTAIEMPMPEPQTAMPRSALPVRDERCELGSIFADNRRFRDHWSQDPSPHDPARAAIGRVRPSAGSRHGRRQGQCAWCLTGHPARIRQWSRATAAVAELSVRRLIKKRRARLVTSPSEDRAARPRSGQPLPR